eukprot:5994636-Pyramimonas_sp.AAC.1
MPVGHLAFAFLMRRPLLSVFGATYRFIRCCCQSERNLWPSVIAEVETAHRLLPLCVAELRLP